VLALQASAYTVVDAYPLDLLGAQTEGMIGYVIQQELGNELPFDVRIASLLTLVEVDAADPAFGNPTKPIGPVYAEEESEKLAKEKGWSFKLDGDSYRRVVPSPLPQRIFGLDALNALLDHGCIVICAGGGGIPVMYTDEPTTAGKRLVGVEAVIDKDLASALLASDLGADALLIVTDVEAVYSDWGTPQQRAIRRAAPHALLGSQFAEGSMGPKVRAACAFVSQTGGFAAIGSIDDTGALLRGEAGTVVALDAAGLELSAVR
jgi:carbamate kinase